MGRREKSMFILGKKLTKRGSGYVVATELGTVTIHRVPDNEQGLLRAHMRVKGTSLTLTLAHYHSRRDESVDHLIRKIDSDLRKLVRNAKKVVNPGDLPVSTRTQ